MRAVITVLLVVHGLIHTGYAYIEMELLDLVQDVTAR